MKENTFVLPRRAFIAGAAATGALALTHPSLVFADEVSDKQAEADAARAGPESVGRQAQPADPQLEGPVEGVLPVKQVMGSF